MLQKREMTLKLSAVAGGMHLVIIRTRIRILGYVRTRSRKL
jgi:hypothetical protein